MSHPIPPQQAPTDPARPPGSPPPHGRSTILIAVLSAFAGVALTAQAVVLPQIMNAWERVMGPSPAPTASGPAVTRPSAAPSTEPDPMTSATSRATTSASLSKGVVLIDTVTTSGKGAGTGMVIDASGLVLTNYHVVRSSTSIRATLADSGATFTATVVGHDATQDVALLRLSGATGLQTVTLDDDRVDIGDPVTALGNAEGQGKLVKAPGTITELDTEVTVADESDPGSSTTIRNVLATTAKAVPGDSGGPMFDAEGEVLGMTSAGSTSQTGRRTGATTQTVSFAVSIHKAMAVVKAIESDHETATIEIGPRAYLGVVVDDTLVVQRAETSAPAAKAGLTAGDTIISINGTRVSNRKELSSALSHLEPGQRVTVTWQDADGSRHSKTVSLAASPVN